MTIFCPTRRAALALGAAAVGTMALADDKPAETPWIDAHSHIWSPDVARWPLAAGKKKEDLAPPSFTDDELLAIARPEGVGRVVLIQHSGYHLFDNAYLLDAAKRRPKVFRVVAMVDDKKPAPGTEMKRLLPLGATGFRITPFLTKAQGAEWLATDGMAEMWQTAAKTGQSMCCLLDPQHLAGVEAMCGKHPETSVVIDHFARIGADGEIREKDVDQLCRLAKQKRVTVKISAYYALGKKQPPYSDLVPMIKRVLEAYGPERLMWASDCPYQLDKGQTYKDSIGLIRDRLDFLTPADRQWLLTKTAERVFFS